MYPIRLQVQLRQSNHDKDSDWDLPLEPHTQPVACGHSLCCLRTAGYRPIKDWRKRQSLRQMASALCEWGLNSHRSLLEHSWLSIITCRHCGTEYPEWPERPWLTSNSFLATVRDRLLSRVWSTSPGSAATICSFVLHVPSQGGRTCQPPWDYTLLGPMLLLLGSSGIYTAEV